MTLIKNIPSTVTSRVGVITKQNMKKQQIIIFPTLIGFRLRFLILRTRISSQTCKRSVPTISRCMTDIPCWEAEPPARTLWATPEILWSWYKSLCFLNQGRKSLDSSSLWICGLCWKRGTQQWHLRASEAQQKMLHHRGGNFHPIHGMLQKAQCLLTPIFPGWQKKQLKFPPKGCHLKVWFIFIWTWAQCVSF